ncbi:MAG: hypothetical protein NUV53_03680 [Patescibacteria group bacterium]|nr:hypothetical protein [Patescibacteria group bacterium]
MFGDIFNIIVHFLDLSKWFIAFFILWPLFESTWIGWRQFTYEHSREFRMVMFEMRIPREIRKGPRAMEQVLMSLYSLRNTAGDFQETWWDGEITKWFTLEIVSFGGEIKFFIRAYYKQRPLVEAAFFAHYPDVELVEVDDYIDQLPSDLDDLYSRGYDAWGSEMVLAKEPAYPIRTYPDFEAPDEERQHDPISSFLEVLSKAKKEETIGIQILIAPASDDWNEKWKGLIDKMKDESSKHMGGKTITNFPGGPLPVFISEHEAENQFKALSLKRTPGETDVLEAIENNLSKPAFETIIRFMYFSPKPLFYDSFARRGITGMFNQYAALDLNMFKQNYSVSTRVKFWHWPHFFYDIRAEYRKASLLHCYRHRMMPHHTFMGKILYSQFFRWDFATKTITLNVEALATLFHPPTFLVLTAPHIKRVESRKTGPPAGLAIYGNEKEIERFQ